MRSVTLNKERNFFIVSNQSDAALRFTLLKSRKIKICQTHQRVYGAGNWNPSKVIVAQIQVTQMLQIENQSAYVAYNSDLPHASPSARLSGWSTSTRPVNLSQTNPVHEQQSSSEAAQDDKRFEGSLRSRLKRRRA
ncbi:hypothetical protein GH714_002767 [Hevea brasiliensis]|uniref:Uncharacterized protein n=1 Tax=Hevea brasiliensis TaxID=3981 RepID=A0A6A6LYR5_HEVBR|nr:hypothetical protein GH714_002767 [Hevea brasiliensis]